MQSISPADENVYDVTLTVALANFITVPAITLSVRLIIECEVLAIDLVTSPTNKNVFNILIDTAVTLSFKFNESPQCGLNYSLSPSKPYVGLDAALHTITIDSKDVASTGVYQFTLVAAPAKLGVSKSAQFEVTMVHFCANTKFLPNPIASVEVFKQDSNYNPVQRSQFRPFSYDAKEKFNIDCGAVKIKLLERGSTLPVPAWIQVDETTNNLSIDFSSLAKPQGFAVDMVAYLEDWPTRNITQSFNVTQSSSELACKAGSTLSYNFGDPPTTFAVNYSNETFVHSLKLTPVKTPFASNTFGEEVALPWFANYNARTSTFSLQKVKYEDLGSYFIGLKIGYVEYPGYVVSCKTRVDVNYQPAFTGDLISDQSIKCGQHWSLKVPKYTDPFGEPAKVLIDLADSAFFLTFDSIKSIITTTNLDTSSVAAGKFKFKVTLIDSLGWTQERSINVVVSCFTGYEVTNVIKATPF